MDQIHKRASLHWPDEQKQTHVDLVIENDGSTDKLHKRLIQAFNL